MSVHDITLRINGQAYQLQVDSNERLVHVIRERLNLTGTKTNCLLGVCGTCTIIMDGQAVNSCSILAVEADEKAITTVEGLANGEDLHPLQQAFMEKGAVQCGYCTPGMLMSMKALLDETPEPTEEEIRRAMVGNLCRCTGYEKIVDAVQAAAQTREEEPSWAPSASR